MTLTTEAPAFAAVATSHARLADELHRAQALLTELDNVNDWSRDAEAGRSAKVLSQLRFLVAAVESNTAEREYGVRLRVPGEADRIIPCGDDLAAAEGVLQNPPQGVIAVEIVGRTSPAWATAPEGLIANVRTTAEQFLDEEIGEGTVCIRLSEWLPGRDIGEVMSGPWPELLEDIESYRRADDGDVDWAMVEPDLRDAELLVQHRDGLVIDAVKRVIGGVR